MYEFFEHTADLGLRARAPTLEELFAEAARGLFSVIVENLEDVRLTDRIDLEIPGEDPAYLMFDWLSELLFRFDTRHLLLREFEVRIVAATGLEATAWGEPVDRKRHRLDHEVKAITYHALGVGQTDDGWQAEVIVDI